MERLVVTIGATIGGSAGWWLGERGGLMAAFLVSMVGTAGGVYAGRRFIRDYLP